MKNLEVRVPLTLAQLRALQYAASNTLAEPANFERGTGHERTERSLRAAHRQISAVLEIHEGQELA